MPIATAIKVQIGGKMKSASFLADPSKPRLETVATQQMAQVDPDSHPLVIQLRQQLSDQVKETASLVAALARGTVEIREMQTQILKEAEQQLLNLSLGIARKVMMQEIKAERYEILPIVQEALSQVQMKENIVVHLSPADHQRFADIASQLGATGADITFASDPAVRPAECMLETPEGIVSSEVDAHLGEIEKNLKAE